MKVQSGIIACVYFHNHNVSDNEYIIYFIIVYLCGIHQVFICICMHTSVDMSICSLDSADIARVSTQRCVVLISFPSMPFKQHCNHSRK